MPTPTRKSKYFSQRLALAMSRTTQPDGSKWTDAAVAAEVARRGEPTSRHYITALRKGKAHNPRQGLVEHLAEVFALPYQWFAEPDDVAERVLLRLLDADQALELHQLRRLVVMGASLESGNLDRVVQLAEMLLKSQDLSADLPHQGSPTEVAPR